jgi:hypothetical protein
MLEEVDFGCRKSMVSLGCQHDFVYPDKIPIYESRSKEWMGHPHVVTHIYIYAHLNQWNTVDSFHQFHQMQQSPKSKSK